MGVTWRCRDARTFSGSLAPSKDASDRVTDAGPLGTPPFCTGAPLVAGSPAPVQEHLKRQPLILVGSYELNWDRAACEPPLSSAILTGRPQLLLPCTSRPHHGSIPLRFSRAESSHQVGVPLPLCLKLLLQTRTCKQPIP